MKRKVTIIILLMLSMILTGAINSYAAEARAYATVLIIIPPKEEKRAENNSEEKTEETSYAQNQASDSGGTQRE